MTPSALALPALLLALTTPLLGQERTHSEQLLADGNLEQARHAFLALVEEHPEDGRSWYGLGETRYALEEFPAAARAYLKAADLEYRPATARYNAACALARAGETDAALDALEDAVVREGFGNVRLMADDADLADLRDDERFGALSAPPEYRPHADAQEVEIPGDGLTLHGVFQQGRSRAGQRLGKSAPFVLLLHQSASNAAEYAAIAPRLAARGFHVLALDARGGGDAYGRTNGTEENWPGRGGGAEAIDDFEAALAWIREQGYTGPLTVWGSSYSAGRLFQLLSRHPDEFAAALAFSPGRAFARPGDDGSPSWAAATRTPVYMTMPAWEYGPDVQARFDAIGSDVKVLRVQPVGAHGSSTLRPDRNPRGWSAEWGPVLRFLQEYARGPGGAEDAGANAPPADSEAGVDER